MLAFTIFLTLTLTISNADNCHDINICDQCTLTQSNNRICVWCPLDHLCHSTQDYGNCSSTQIIIQLEKCPNPFSPIRPYNESIAKRALNFSFAALYDPETCWMALDRTVLIDAYIKMKCDFFGDKCFAYTAISPKDKAIIVTYRGSTNIQIIAETLDSLGYPDSPYMAGGKILHYFRKAFDSLWPSVLSRIHSLRLQYPEYELWLTGHSLGGSLASISAIQLTYNQTWPKEKLKLITFGQPRTGSYWFARAHDQFVPYSWRVVHKRDIVPHLPPCKRKHCTGWKGDPYHHGVEIWYDNDMKSNDTYKVCNGYAYNEDEKCSDGLTIYNPADHLMYFGLNAHKFC